MNKMKTNKGITLVALIITIVVLMILAFVAIAAVQNDNIITKAETAKQMDAIAKEKEIIELAKLEAKLEQSNVPYLNKVKDILDENNTLDAELKGNQLTITFKESNRTYIIDNTGNVTSRRRKNIGFTRNRNNYVYRRNDMGRMV